MCMDLVKPDPGLVQSKPEPIVYRCKKCRRVVAAKSNTLTHTRVAATESPLGATVVGSTGTAIVDKLTKKLRDSSIHSNDRSSEGDSAEKCKEILFIEPLAWMTDVCKQTQGKLNCPKCQSKLGSFTWINACNCPCGKQVSPAFYLVPSKVELSHIVQNVQTTV